MVKSLIDLCTAVCLRNIKDIDDMGYAPYGIVRPILQKIDNAAQLRRIEMNSPHLEGETAECWKRLIARDFPVLDERHRYVPTNPKSWHKVYAKYHHLDRSAKREAEEKLKNAFKEIKKEKDTNVSRVINYDSRKLPRLPRDVKPQVGTRPKSNRMGPDQSELRFTGGSRTKTNTPKSLLKRAIREAKEISTRNRLNTPVGAKQVRPGQILKAPVGMVQEKVTNARPLTGIRPPSYHPASSSRSREMEDREARLRKAKEMNSQRGGSYMDDEDLEDLDIEGEDGIGLDIDDLEALDDEPEPSYRPRPADSSSGSARGSVFARKMGSSSAPPSSRPEAQTKQKPTPARKDQTLGPTSPPLRPVASGSSVTSPTLPPAAQRKRKAVDIFMRPKPKAPRT
ncbi:hypothetical protein GGR51DRAFT_550219 [Nemania sp. FL0031]|nr:hypothetical protein GGR51DRAFT_550219 [Nemania sp. FL0031]